MGKQDLIKIDGVIVEALSNAMFRVKLQNGHEIISTISGKMRMNYIKILPHYFTLISSSMALKSPLSQKKNGKK